MHYKQRQKLGNLEPLVIPSLAEHLAAGLERKPNGCLEWTGQTNDTGYGRALIEGKVTRVHRAVWTLANGPIPEGMCVCHKCDNRLCGDVEHLFLGTHDDNMADMAAKGRSNQQQKTHCPANHPYDEANTYVDKNGKRYCRACGRAKTARHKAKVKARAII